MGMVEQVIQLAEQTLGSDMLIFLGLALAVNLFFSISFRISDGDSFFLNFFKGLIYVAIFGGILWGYHYYFHSYPLLEAPIIIMVIIYAILSVLKDERKKKKFKKYTEEKEDKKENTDFSVSSYWVSFAVCTAMYIAIETGTIPIKSDVAQLIVGYFVGIIVYLAYLKYRTSKLVHDFSLNKKEFRNALFMSLFAQWGLVLAMMLPGFGIHVPVQHQNDDDVFYQNCTDARAQGAAPVYKNDPGYYPALDRDGDGIGCE